MSADSGSPFDDLEGSETSGGERPKYRPPIERPPSKTRRWIIGSVIVLILALIAIPILGHFGIRLWPRSADEFDAVALTNKHGGTAGVYFSGRVTKDEARQVGRLMIEVDAFGGAGGADILLDRDGDAVVVCVFYPIVPPTEVLNEFCPPIRKRLSDELFASGPVVIEVCTQNVNVMMNKVRRDVRVRYT